MLIKENISNCLKISLNPELIKNWSLEDVVLNLNFFDWNGRFSYLNHKLNDTFVDKYSLLQPKEEHIYQINLEMHRRLMILNVLLAAVIEIIDKNGKGYFALIKNLFEVELRDTYNFPSLPLCNLSEGGTIIEKIRSIIPEIENILHQFTQYVNAGTIDPDLLSIENFQGIDSVPSLIYPNFVHFDDVASIEEINFILFSDQCSLKHKLDTTNEYDNLYELILHKEITNGFIHYEELNSNCMNMLNKLEENGFIKLIGDKRLMPINEDKWIVYFELYDKGYLNFHLNCTSVRQYLSDAIKIHEIHPGKKLFSIPECSYLSYLLNDVKFTNGLKLRNKYMHGKGTYSVKAMREDYYKILYILTLIVIRIQHNLQINFIVHNIMA